MTRRNAERTAAIADELGLARVVEAAECPRGSWRRRTAVSMVFSRADVVGASRRLIRGIFRGRSADRTGPTTVATGTHGVE